MLGGNRSYAAALALVLTTLALPKSADAFCRTTTEPEKCASWRKKGGTGCCPYGMPLYWKNACVGYSLQKNGTKFADFDHLTEMVADAFARWTEIMCPTRNGESSPVSIDAKDLGPVNCAEVNYETNGPNQNVIIFRDDGWTHLDSDNTLGLTTVQFEPHSGEIRDADIEINTAQHDMAFEDPVPSDKFDFQSVITHEAGHFLGLAHSSKPQAAMFATHERGSTRIRGLADDDQNGLCEIYPPDGTRSVGDGGAFALRAAKCDPTPVRGFSKECSGDTTNPGCETSKATVAESSGTGVVSSAGILTAVLVCRWRRRRQRRIGR